MASPACNWSCLATEIKDLKRVPHFQGFSAFRKKVYLSSLTPLGGPGKLTFTVANEEIDPLGKNPFTCSEFVIRGRWFFVFLFCFQLLVA